jgi:hypothetical protein
MTTAAIPNDSAPAIVPDVNNSNPDTKPCLQDIKENVPTVTNCDAESNQDLDHKSAARGEKRKFPQKKSGTHTKRPWEYKQDRLGGSSDQPQKDTRPGTRPEGYVPEARPEGEKRLPKRKVALLMGFCGKGYSGMQM